MKTKALLRSKYIKGFLLNDSKTNYGQGGTIASNSRLFDKMVSHYMSCACKVK